MADTNFDLLTHILPKKGIYLVFASVSTNAGSSTIVNCDIRGGANTEILLKSASKIKSEFGPGTTGWALVSVTSTSGTVILTTYGYGSGYTVDGRLCAVLIKPL